MARRFHQASGTEAHHPYDQASVARMLNLLMSGADGMLLVAEHRGKVIGMAAAFVYPCWFNTARKVAQEFIWWVQPEHRNGRHGRALHDKLEAWARSRGAHSLEMIALYGELADGLDSYYRRRGYERLEQRYIKRLR